MSEEIKDLLETLVFMERNNLDHLIRTGQAIKWRKGIEQLQKEHNILTEFERWLEETINKLKQSQLEITKLNIPNYSKAINIKEFNIRITTNSICLDKLQELKGKK